MDITAKIETLKDMIMSSKRIAFLGGAGVSTESGIPDFRSENGYFEAIRRFGYPPEELLSHTFFMRHTDIFYKYYRSALMVTGIKPNRAHYALAKLERVGRLTAVVTQNIDGLHQLAGSRNVYELHGSIYRNHCMECGKSYTVEQLKDMPNVPICSCGGVIKPDVVLYEEGLDADTLRAAITHITRADMLIVGGTSLNVYPASGLIDYYKGNKLALINKSETPYDYRADLIINDSIGMALDKATEGLE